MLGGAGLLGIGLLALLGRSEPHRPSGGRRWVLVGDSHLHRVALGGHFISAIERAGNQVVGVFQNNGWSLSRYHRTDLAQQLARLQPDVVLFSLGGNNRQAESDYRDSLRWALQAARAAGAREIRWVGPATARDDLAPTTARWHRATAEFQRRHLPPLAADVGVGLRWVDSLPITRAHHRDDGVHFTRAGYATWAQGARSLFT